MTDPSHFTDPAWAAQITAEEERKAVEWLRSTVPLHGPVVNGYSATLLRMLARPVMPEEPTTHALLVMDLSAPGESQFSRTISERMYRALYAHLSRTKTKTVWRVTWSGIETASHAYYATLADAAEALVGIVGHGRDVVITIAPIREPA